MKKILLTSGFIFLLFWGGYAQKVNVKKNVILVDEQAYALLKNVSGDSYSLHTLQGKELVYFKLEELPGQRFVYEVIFRESGEKGLLENQAEIGLFGDKKMIAKKVVESDLVQGENLNLEGKKRFLQIYPYKAPQITTGTMTTQNTNYVLVERDRQAMIFATGKNINQGGILIATYTEESIYSQEKGNQFSYKIYLPNGALVAEAIFDTMTSNEGFCITSKDNKKHFIRFESSLSRVENIAKYLTDLYYL